MATIDKNIAEITSRIGGLRFHSQFLSGDTRRAMDEVIRRKEDELYFLLREKYLVSIARASRGGDIYSDPKPWLAALEKLDSQRAEARRA